MEETEKMNKREKAEIKRIFYACLVISTPWSYLFILMCGFIPGILYGLGIGFFVGILSLTIWNFWMTGYILGVPIKKQKCQSCKSILSNNIFGLIFLNKSKPCKNHPKLCDECCECEHR